MNRPVVAMFCMPEPGHFAPLRALVAGLAERGFSVQVFTDARFADEVGRMGGVFVDLFSRYPIEEADNESMPVPCRFVTFAGVYADRIIRDVRKLEPVMIIYETFAVIGRVVAAAVGCPYINVVPNHGMNPSRLIQELRSDPRVRIAPSCHRAVERLSGHHDMQNASPFSYVSGTSPYLNIYCEPPDFISDAARQELQPLEFFGSLPPMDRLGSTGESARDASNADTERLRIFACFGTVIWRYYKAQALQVLGAVSRCVGEMGGAWASISLGGADVDTDVVRSLTRANVRVEGYVDQWEVLAHTDVFVTHHGLNSTHEALFHRVPMISYPFFGDQPALAEQCRMLGVAVPLVQTLRGTVTVADVRAALFAVAEAGVKRSRRLEQARDQELMTINNRGRVLDRISRLQTTSLRPAVKRGERLRAG